MCKSSNRYHVQVLMGVGHSAAHDKVVMQQRHRV